MPDIAYHRQPHDRGSAGLEVEPIPDKKDIRRRVTSSAPVVSVHWVVLKGDPARLFHLANHAVFDGLMQLKYVTWCGRAQHVVHISPAGGDYPQVSVFDQCPDCAAKVTAFIDQADNALKGR